MSDIAAFGFWSYAHDDNRAEQGRIARLRDRIQEEYKMLAGSEIDIIIDKEHLRWGQNFRDRLESAIEETTFFIPILTETYFLSEECRREFQQFVATAKELGLEQLLLSIRYGPVRDLREDSTDQLKALAASMQYSDWTSLRLEEETSAAYRKGVNALAGRLVELTTTAETLLPRTDVGTSSSLARRAIHGARSTDLEAATSRPSDDDDDSPGLLDLAASFPDKSSAWTSQIERVSKSMQAVTAPFADFGPKLAATNNHKNPFAARVRLSRELAQTVEAPLSLFESDSREYVTRLSELDPVVSAILEAAISSNAKPEDSGMTAIQGLVETSKKAMGQLDGAADIARANQGISKDLRPILRRYETAIRNMVDAQHIIDNWGKMISDSGK